LRACVVLDASVVVKWFLDEEGSEAARALRSADLAVSAPHLLLLEVANVFWRHVRKGALEIATGSDVLSVLGEAPIEWHEDAALFKEAYRLATELGRTVYDSLYLALAVRLDSVLITADRKFYDAVFASRLASRIVWIEDAV
jgi:predicted nucleic acid-binding protein